VSAVPIDALPRPAIGQDRTPGQHFFAEQTE
jgi:hypothetical protein